MRRAVFLDRDGIINIERNYVFRIEDFEFSSKIFEICNLFLENNFLLIVITNQAGIAKGYFQEKDFHLLNNWMLKKFLDNGIPIAKVYYCPHHSEAKIEEFKKNCQCRKPKPGMILTAIKEFELDIANSFLIGDKESDIETGINAGLKNNILVKTHPEINYQYKSKAIYQFDTLPELYSELKYILMTNNLI